MSDSGRFDAVPNPGMDRRVWLQSAGAAAVTLAAQGASTAPRADDAPTTSPKPTYENQARGIRILPGQWRPHYPWEHIVWISPPWPSQDYLWLDFPEAVFTNLGLLYLSHINPPIPTVYADLPAIPWRRESDGVSFERELPNGVAFGGRVSSAGPSAVDLELYIRNGAAEPLTDITLQTCAFLRAIREFGDYSQSNKFVHVADGGWIGLADALQRDDGTAPYRVGWRRSGRRVADLPVAVALSNKADRLLAMSWGEHTLSMVGNPNHPCIHADPYFADLAPQETGRIRGRIVFFEGPLAEFGPEEHFS